MSLISKRAGKIKPSPTFVVAAKAQNLIKQGRDIISLTVGEPDFDTPDHVKQAAYDAIKAGKTKYTNVDGIVELKEAIRVKFKRDNDLDYNLDEITVGSGGKQVIYNLFMASIDEGDEVIVPAPYWVSYPDIVTLASGSPVIVQCGIESGFKLTPSQLREAITPKTKWLILNSPSNPTGSAYSHQELEALGEVLRQNPHVNIMSDDIYEHVIFENSRFANIAMSCPDLKERVFIVNGVSKTYSMTGWRIGYGVGDKALIKAMNIIQSQSTSNPCSISQHAALAAISGNQDFVGQNAKTFQEKRDIAYEILSSIEGIECHKPEGAFYIFPSVSALFGCSTVSGAVIESDIDFAEYLLEEGVAVVPGSAFGAAGFIRLSTATSKDALREGCERVKRACAKLMPAATSKIL